MTKIEEIRNRWGDCSWPRIGFFVHGAAREDIASLLAEIDRLQKREALFKREIAAADAIVTIGDKQIVVPSAVKTEIDGLRAGTLPAPPQ